AWIKPGRRGIVCAVPRHTVQPASTRPLLAAIALTLAFGADACTRAPATQAPFRVWEAPIQELQAAMAAGRVTSEALVGMYLDRIAAYDQQGPVLHTLIRLNPRAAAEAAALDQERKTKGPRGPLHGIPIVIKDNYD